MSGNIGIGMVNDSDLGSFTEAELEYLIGEDIHAGSSGSAEIEYDMGFIIGATVGYDFNNYRLESELAYLMNDIDKFSASINIPGTGTTTAGMGADCDVTTLVLLFNGYYDFLSGSKLRPYITGGIGLANIEQEIVGNRDDDTVFAYQVGTDLGYDMSEKVTLDLRYRYLGTSDPEYHGWKVEYSGHSLVLATGKIEDIDDRQVAALISKPYTVNELDEVIKKVINENERHNHDRRNT